jgi:hypothetical protein
VCGRYSEVSIVTSNSQVYNVMHLRCRKTRISLKVEVMVACKSCHVSFSCHKCNLFQQTTSAACKQIVVWVPVCCNLYEVSFEATLLNDLVRNVQCS